MSDPEPPNLIDVGTSGGLSARINCHGAQLWELADRDGTDLLWSGDPQVWSGRAPILFPIVGELAGGTYRYNSSRYPLARHGFARTSHFVVIEQSADAASLRLAATDATRKIYPFDFQLDLRFTCGFAGLEVAANVRNLGDEKMPFSFGFHPALRWPLAGQSRADHAIHFAQPEPAPISRLDAQGLVLPTPQPTPVAGRRLALHDDLFIDDALMFTQLASRSVTYGRDATNGRDGTPGRDGAGRPTRHIRVDFEHLPMLGVWTKPGAGYICIEPWQGLADPQGFAGDIFAKPGIVTLPPGAGWQARMTLTSEQPL